MTSAGTDSITMQDLADNAESVARYLAERASLTPSMTDDAQVESEAALSMTDRQIATLSALLAAAEAVARKRGT